jgi:integrase
VDVATPTIKPIILFMASSGCARMETLNLTIGDYIEAVSEYTNETNIFDIIADLGNCEGVVPTFHIKRQKTGKHFTTFCSPEATLAINNYLLWRIDSLLDRRRLFKVDPNYFTHGFSLVNERLNLGKVGNYNRFRSHMLRKFHASALYNDGMPMEKVNELQGKAKNQTDTAYFMANPDDLKEEYIKHLPALTMSKEIEKITVKSPEFIKMEKENAEYKKRMDGIDEEIKQLKRDVFANIK